MKPFIVAVGIFLANFLIVSDSFAEASSKKQAPETRGALAAGTKMTEDKDGILQPGEFEVISTNGSITRSKCPYTCEMRGLPKEHCNTWQSLRDKELCYVEDTRNPSDAIPR